MAAPSRHPDRKRLWTRRLLAVVLGAACLTPVLVLGRALVASRWANPPPPVVPSSNSPRPLMALPQLTLWWDVLPPDVRNRSVPSGQTSNIAPADYAGPQACKECHPGNYESWSRHPHRWMNALAGETTVKGDFSGAAALAYRGGQATFYRQADTYFMRLERADVRRTYAITQTIGSRFFQYYVGKQVEGPEPRGHPFYAKDHVLQFGYWLDRREWVPVIHIGPEVPDGERPDPFAPLDHGRYYAEYAVGCNSCHTTFPLADQFGRHPDLIGNHAPVRLHWSMRDYLAEAHPEVLPAMASFLDEGGGRNPLAGDEPEGDVAGRGLQDQGERSPMADWEASKHAVTLGVSCEACHLGAREHVASRGKVPPKFFPSSPHLAVEARELPLNFGRSHDNVNWACGRCHTGNRPQFAAGMSTWNSVEYADAMRGSCYSELRCIDCHSPHRALGPRWTRSADEDDAVCLKCHGKFAPAAPRLAHTHHPAGSEGARCLNCHMPRINEGIQEVVRTHMIYSPTRADMIEANHPNACNLCHTDRPIDWTLRALKEWYGATYDERKIAAHYPERDAPVAVGWLKSENPSVRLVAAAALSRTRDPKALPQLLEALDDPYLVNRQFAGKGLEEMLNLRLGDSGYHFWMTQEERRRPLAELRGRVLHPAATERP